MPTRNSKSTRKNKIFRFVKLIISILLIVLAFYPKRYKIVYYKSNFYNVPIPLPEDIAQAKINAGNLDVPVFKSPKTYTKFGELNIDFTNAEGVWLYFTPDIKYVTNDYEASKRFLKHKTLLQKKNIPISNLQPVPDFKTDFKILPLRGISNIRIKSNSDITTAPTSLTSKYSVSNIIENKTFYLDTKSFTLGNCTSTNSKFYKFYNPLNINSSDLKKTELNCDSLSLLSVKIENSTFITGYSNFIDVEILSDNILLFKSEAKIEKLKGTGTLYLKSSGSITSDAEKTIQTFQNYYGNIDRIYYMTKPAKVKLSNTDISLIDFDPEQIRILVDTSSNNKLVDRMYINLINRFKDNEKERRLYDVEYHHYLRGKTNSFWFKLNDVLWEQWSNYSYEKDNIYRILWRSLLFFFSVNYLFFPYIIRYGYCISNFYRTYIKTRRRGITSRVFTDAYFSFIYTLLLFWIFRIELNQLRVDKPLIFIWILLQHLISLILLSFAIKELIL